MIRHRFREQLERSGEAIAVRPEVASLDGFMVCPLAVQQWVCERTFPCDVYELAWQRTLETARPSIVDRFRCVSPN